jgi:hypothetical protein
MLNDEIIRMIDEYLEEPNCIDPKWVEALIEIKKIIARRWRERMNKMIEKLPYITCGNSVTAADSRVTKINELVDAVNALMEKKEEPKGYSGLVVCVEGSYKFTAGRVYRFKDGQVNDDDGVIRPYPKVAIKTLDDWNDLYSAAATFFELKDFADGAEKE